ncbi:DUF4421 family protein [Winogradskyella aurantia]|uniref:DUF4421 domain-containing protein n=1 Tax=Winogradskyella aurantia TaxID=1915063 RepID=A0A265UTC6_9FLAO|nr:DUF4421 family protein [Winogradskyella aurantia]OZV68569.1 hypothetical protein CA834_08845 [Winogradskyella aurantia]
MTLKTSLSYRLLFFVLYFCPANLVFSQNIRPYDLEKQAAHAELKGYDASYRVNYFENIIIRSFITSDIANFQFRSSDGQRTFDLVPAAEYLLGLSLDYKWIALEVSFAPAFRQTDAIEDLSNSSSLRLGLNFFYSDQLRQEFSYTRLVGFINTNSETGLSDRLRLLNNTELQTIRGSTYYIANKNFSFRSHYAQTERQLRSAGSLIPKLTYTYSITDPNLEIPVETINTAQLKSFDLIFQMGYLYTFVAKEKWFATIGVHPGVGYNSARYEFLDQSNQLFNNISFAFDSELKFGYNSYRWFFGVGGNWRNFNILNNEANQLNRDNSYLEAYLGFRFNDNKPMRKFFGWFEDHLGF